MGIFGKFAPFGTRESAEIRRKIVADYNARQLKAKKVASASPKKIENKITTQPIVQQSVKDVKPKEAEPVAVVPNVVNDFVDDIVNPENHPDAPVDNEPVAVSSSKHQDGSEAPTDIDDEESEEEEEQDQHEQDRSEDIDKTDDFIPAAAASGSNIAGSNIAGAGGDEMNSKFVGSVVQGVMSEESKVVETIQPPNILKGATKAYDNMEKESMEKFVDEQRAQAKTGFLCGCI